MNEGTEIRSGVVVRTDLILDFMWPEFEKKALWLEKVCRDLLVPTMSCMEILDVTVPGFAASLCTQHHGNDNGISLEWWQSTGFGRRLNGIDVSITGNTSMWAWGFERVHKYSSELRWGEFTSQQRKSGGTYTDRRRKLELDGQACMWIYHFPEKRS